MLLTDILAPECVRIPLTGRTRDAVIRELIDLLAANGDLCDRDGALEAVLARERTGSTGIGCGVALPHAKSPGVRKLVMAAGLTEHPVDFQSPDEKPVRIVLLLLSPPDETGPHIQALARVSRILSNGRFRKKLLAVESAEEAYELFRQHEMRKG